MAKADITIRGKTYSVACAPGQEVRLTSLSKELDMRVQQIADAVGDIGDDRILLITSLALLDELDAARHGQATATGPDVDRAAKALDDAADRILGLVTRIEGST
ncbi:MAG: cell division protein ZapA [Pseudomonadota bacterium]